MSIITEQSPLMFNDALPAAVDVVVIGANLSLDGLSFLRRDDGQTH